MSAEVLEYKNALQPKQLADALRRAYVQFGKGEPLNVGAIYAGIDFAANIQVGLHDSNPLISAFNLSLRGEVSPPEKTYFTSSSYVLLDPFRDFEGENVSAGVSSWAETISRDGRFSRVKGLIDASFVGRLAAKGKSIGLFYEHLAGSLDLDDDSIPKGFNDSQPGYFDLLIADFLHGRGRELIFGFMKGSRVIEPPPARFDRDYEAIERFREEERGRWGTIAALDLVAMEAWQRYLGYGTSEERRGVATLAVEKYSKSIAGIERLKDITAEEARDTLNPFKAL